MWKRFLLGLACALGIGATAVKLFPEASPFGPALQVASATVKEHADKMLDPCSATVCGRDERGRCVMCGTIGGGLPDGGSCVCE